MQLQFPIMWRKNISFSGSACKTADSSRTDRRAGSVPLKRTKSSFDLVIEAKITFWALLGVSDLQVPYSVCVGTFLQKSTS